MGKIGKLLLASVFGLMLTFTVVVGAAAAPRASERIDAVKDVAVADNFFNPARVQIHRGDRVRWTNGGNNTHTSTSDDGLWNRTLVLGATFTRQFNRVGVFHYHCNLHAGMTGTIRVVA
jgi:plastocyanin